MPVHLTCPHCGTRMAFPESLGGETAPCAGCGNSIPCVAPSEAKASPPTWARGPIVIILPMLVAAGVCAFVAILAPLFAQQRTHSPPVRCPHLRKQVGLAMQNYHEAHGHFPPAYLTDEEGMPAHSWRVLLLPYLEEQGLYEQYDFDQPWDSPANLALANRMPEAYCCPAAKTQRGTPQTSYAMLVGPGMVSDGPTGTSLQQLLDGSSQTILMVEVDAPGIHWLEPRDISLEDFLAQFGRDRTAGNHPGVVNVLFCDGSVHSIPRSFSPRRVRALCTIAGGEDASQFQKES